MICRSFNFGFNERHLQDPLAFGAWNYLRNSFYSEVGAENPSMNRF